MARLTYAQLEGVWLKAAAGTKYATQQWAALMAAIAEAESGGDPQATNPNDNGGTQTSWGLWQISTGTHSEPSPSWADPVTNARLAIGKLNSQGLQAWGTYDSGAYRQFMSGSTTPDQNFPSGPGAPDAGLTAAAPDPTCSFSIGGQHLSILFGHGPSLPSACLWHKIDTRHAVGAVILGAAIPVGVAAVLVLAAFGFRQSGAQRAVLQAARVMPGAGRLARAAAAAAP